MDPEWLKEPEATLTHFTDTVYPNVIGGPGGETRVGEEREEWHDFAEPYKGGHGVFKMHPSYGWDYTIPPPQFR